MGRPMTLINTAAQPTIGWPIVRRLGQAIAYLCVPATLIVGPSIESMVSVLIGIYLLAAIGFVAVVRGANVPAIVVQIGYFMLAWYCILFAIELINGDLVKYPRPINSDFLSTYFILLALPFLAMGLREVGVDFATLEKVVMATVVLAAGWSMYQYFALRVFRPGGLNGLNPITFGMIVTLWSLFLLAHAMGSKNIRITPAAVAMAGLIPVLLGASKLIWACAALGYAMIFLWWFWTSRQWLMLGAVAVATAGAGLLVSRIPFVQRRMAEFSGELTAFVTTGDTSGQTFGLRFAAATSGWLAFADRPFTGYGLADVKLAAVTNRPEHVADITQLWHLHNQYITHLVAFGVLGVVFLISLLTAFAVVAWRTRDVSLQRFGATAALMLSIYMSVELFFPRTPLYGTVFLLFALLLVAAADRESSAIQAKRG